MSSVIEVKKGLDIKLVGDAEKKLGETTKSKVFAVKPVDFHGITPKLTVKVGDKVKAGQSLFFAKSNDNILFASPVSGEVSDIVRGAKRRIMSIVILADDTNEYADGKALDVEAASKEQIKETLLNGGCWPFIKQRPYDVIANPLDEPKDIFISGLQSAPLSNDLSFSLEGKEKEIQTAVNALKKLTSGKVHISVGNDAIESAIKNIEGVEYHALKGKHPKGNVSVQIANVSPINKGERVWTVAPQDLVVIGEYLLTGKFNMERVVALTGYRLNHPQYVKAIAGSSIKSLVEGNVFGDDNRFISGDVLTGRNEGLDGYLGYYSNVVTVIKEGDDYTFMGWNLPQPSKFSILKANMFSYLTPNKKYELNTNTNGEERAFVLTGQFEKVFPFDIYPMQLLKACLTQNIDRMEALGIYEIAPEDFALTEFVDTSKNNHQDIIRKGLDLMIKEVG